MKRVKTKQEWNLSKQSGTYFTIKGGSLFGLPYDLVKDEHYRGDRIGDYTHPFTNKPHPFDNLDIKVRVTPKQSKKLQKKAFKMGYWWRSREEIKHTDKEFLYLYKNKEITCGCETDLFNRHKNIELTYKQFMNGTVPKKQFKVDDWVEVNETTVNKFFKAGYIGRIESKLDLNDGSYMWIIEGNQVHEYELKHTTKPKEQPLMYKEWDVKIERDLISIGCKTFTPEQLKHALMVMSAVSPHTDLVHFMQWLINDKTKLGL